MRTCLIAGNWKMHLTPAEGGALANTLRQRIGMRTDIEIVLCPPFVALPAVADALRGSMDAAEYKHVVLGLIFLKYVSDAFEERRRQLQQELDQGANPEDPDEYRAERVVARFERVYAEMLAQRWEASS